MDTMSSTTPERPRLTLPEAEAAWLRERYAAAETILEYGSGGSTVVAAELGRRVISVESDANWAQMMRDYFAASAPPVMPRIHHADVGPTKKWGMPVNNRNYDRFASYPLAIWDHEDFVQPDLVLIDGRFRVGCLLACLFRSKRPVTVLFDDYAKRRQYHVVERFVPRAETRGRMVRFEVTPRAIGNDELPEIMDLMLRKR